MSAYKNLLDLRGRGDFLQYSVSSIQTFMLHHNTNLTSVKKIRKTKLEKFQLQEPLNIQFCDLSIYNIKITNFPSTII